MKKLFIAVLIAATTFTSVFAFDIAKINYKTKTAFEAQYTGATNVTWTVKETFTKAAFTMDEQNIEVFYDNNGEQIAISRAIDFKALPLKAIQKIKKDYAGYTISETIEMDINNDKRYYVSLRNGTAKHMLSVSISGSVSIYKATE